MARCTLPVNLAGVPALALPVPSTVALAGQPSAHRPHRSEETLLAAGLVLEAAVATL